MSMLSFWIYYGVLMVLWFGFFAYWAVHLVDKYLNSLTDGDYNNLIVSKFIDPLFLKLKLHRKRSYYGDVVYDDESASGVCTFVVSVIGACIPLVSLLSQWEPMEATDGTFKVHELTVQIATFLSQEATLPLLIVLGFVGLHTTLKKVYKFGKKVKPLVDSINKEGK